MAARDEHTKSGGDAGPVVARDSNEKHFLVAIGDSAGGLDALERLFSSMPSDTGAAFVVVQHLSPDHKSMMASLLSQFSRWSSRG